MITIAGSRYAVYGLASAAVLALAFAISGMPGFLPWFAVAVIATVVGIREGMVMPGSLFICFFTLLMILAPYLDLRLEILPARMNDLYTVWPEPHLLLGIVTMVMVMLCVHLATLDRWKIRWFHLVIRRIPVSHLIMITGMGIACEVVLFAMGAGRHTAGFNSIPFVGVLNVVKTMSEMLIVVAAFSAVRNPRKFWFIAVIGVILAENLVTSLLSGRKEDLLMTVTMTLIGFWASVRSPGAFLLKTVAPLLIVAFVFLPFMYRLRMHPAFNHMDQTSTPLQIVQDTFEHKYDDLENRSSFLQRLDLLEPTSRYFGTNTVPMYDQRDIWMLLACSVIPRFLWADKPADQPALGYQFAVHYGYASDFGITSIAFGYLVELHFLFGWIGVLMLILLPWGFNSGPMLSLLGTGRAWPLVQMWMLFRFAIFVERTLVVGFIEMLPYLILALCIEGGLACTRYLYLHKLFPRPMSAALGRGTATDQT